MADFDTPVLKEYPVIPHIQEGVMAHSKPQAVITQKWKLTVYIALAQALVKIP